MNLPIYLDNHSTTQVDPRVFDAMKPFFLEHYGNSASVQHTFGWNAEAAVDQARKSIADLINAEPDEIIFTSGATEANNLAIKGIAEAYSSKGNRLISVMTEHRSVLDPLASLTKKGFDVTRLPVDEFGMIDLNLLQNSVTSKTILVSIMLANNEIGTIQQISDIGRICSEKNVLLHSDITQAVGKIPVDLKESIIDLASFSPHKFYGPKGIGALFVKKRFPKIKIVPQISGGGHEQGLRSGTLNVPGIVGFGKACEISRTEMIDEMERIKKLRDRLFAGLKTQFQQVFLNGHPEKRLLGNLNLRFANVESDLLLAEIRDIAFSSGSACSSFNPEPSHVLQAIGLSEREIKSSIRFGIGRFNTVEEIDYTISKFVLVVNKIRNSSSQFLSRFIR